MIRFMGFVTGAAAAIGLMLWLFGLPEVVTEVQEQETAEIAPDTVEAIDLPTAADLAAEDPTASPPASASTVELAPEPEPDDRSPTPDDAVTPMAAEAQMPKREDPPLDAPQEFDIAVGDAPLAQDLRWHAFWSPFRSRIAADGFISRLEAITGFDYRVVKIDNGVYEVAFGYASDDERLTKLATIEAATGLEMPDS